MSLSEEIKNAWAANDSVSNLGDLANRLRTMMSSLRRWSLDKFGSVNKELGQIRDKLEELNMLDYHTHKVEIDSLMKGMDELLYREEIMWLQRSKIQWLKEGDRNTKFFQRKAAWRAKKNKVKKLQKANGQFTQDKKEMETMTTEYFKELYKEDTAVCPDELLDIIEPKITEEMNEDLCRDFTDDEISDALFQIGPLKRRIQTVSQQGIFNETGAF